MIISAGKHCKYSGKYTGLPIRIPQVQIWLRELSFFFSFFFFIFIIWFIFYSSLHFFVPRVAKHSSQTFNINTRITIKAHFLVIVGRVLVLRNSAVPSFLKEASQRHPELQQAYWIATGWVWRIVSSVFSILFSSTRARPVLVKDIIFLAS